MENFQLFLLVLQVVIAVVLVALVLLQKSDGDSLSGISSGSSNPAAAISKRTSASILSKTTMFLIAVFMLNCLILAALSDASNKSIKEDLNKAIEQQEKTETPAKPSAPTVPPVQ